MKKNKQLRLAIIITSIVGLLSLFSLTMTTLAWGTANTSIYFLLLYPVLFITTILIIANIRLAYLIMAVVVIAYATLLNREIGKLFVFESHNNILYLVLALPYFALLTLVPLTISYLTAPSKHKRFFVTTATLIAISFPTFAIAERFNMNYLENIFVDAEISAQGQVTFKCKPGFADSRTFIVTSNSSTIAEQVRKYGKYYQGSYFLHNTTIKKNYRFSKLKSVTLTKVNNHEIVPEVTWTVDEIKGDASFLRP